MAGNDNPKFVTIEVPHDVELPPVCLRTGSLVGLSRRREMFFWYPYWAAIGAFIPLLGKSAMKNARLTYYLSERSRQDRHAFIALEVAAFVVVLGPCIFFALREQLTAAML